jgi:hypothetical protein
MEKELSEGIRVGESTDINHSKKRNILRTLRHDADWYLDLIEADKR